MKDAVLTINAGSSSIKFALFTADEALMRLAYGAVENIGTRPHFTAFGTGGAQLAEKRWPQELKLSHEDLLSPLLDWAEEHLQGAHLIAAGHRIVHGGANFTGPVKLDEATIAALAALTPLAPLHQPHNLSPVRAVAALRPGLPQIGCFDTGFHCTMPEYLRRLPIPGELNDAGVRRYGFHGLSYEYISRRLRVLVPGLADKRVIAAHLGNGASLCAMKDGKSFDTTMGFTALDGLIMGTRTGSIDPGVVLYLMQERHMGADDISALLYEKSGLLGISGLSSDMRTLLGSESPHAAEAVKMFTHRCAREITALATSIGGLDLLVFTAGIGENAPAIRSKICAELVWLGLELNEQANVASASLISAPASRTEIRVVPTNEEAMIAIHCREFLSR